MQHRSIFLWLKSKTRAFHIHSQVAEWLERDFPHIEIVPCDEFDELKDLMPDADVVLTWYFEKAWYDNAPKLKWVFTPAAGQDWVPRDPMGRVDVNYGKFHGPLIAESLMSMMLYHQRNLSKLIENQSHQVYDRNSQSSTRSLRNKKVMIWGYGEIGDHCAQVLQAFGCQIYGVCRTPSSKRNQSNTELFTPLEAKAHLVEMDIIISLLPSGDEIVMDTEFFHSLKNGVQFYSMGRGSAISESALVNVLNTGLVSFAGLDVFQNEPLSATSPLWEHPHVLISPHSACVMEDYAELFYQEIRPQLEEIFK